MHAGGHCVGRSDRRHIAAGYKLGLAPPHAAHQMGIWVPACAAALAVAVARPAAPPVAVAEAAAWAKACRKFGGGAVAAGGVTPPEFQTAAARRLDHPMTA